MYIIESIYQLEDFWRILAAVLPLLAKMLRRTVSIYSSNILQVRFVHDFSIFFHIFRCSGAHLLWISGRSVPTSTSYRLASFWNTRPWHIVPRNSRRCGWDPQMSPVGCASIFRGKLPELYNGNIQWTYDRPCFSVYRGKNKNATEWGHFSVPLFSRSPFSAWKKCVRTAVLAIIPYLKSHGMYLGPPFSIAKLVNITPTSLWFMIRKEL